MKYNVEVSSFRPKFLKTETSFGNKGELIRFLKRLPRKDIAVVVEMLSGAKEIGTFYLYLNENGFAQINLSEDLCLLPVEPSNEDEEGTVYFKNEDGVTLNTSRTLTLKSVRALRVLLYWVSTRKKLTGLLWD